MQMHKMNVKGHKTITLNQHKGKIDHGKDERNEKEDKIKRNKGKYSHV